MRIHLCKNGNNLLDVAIGRCTQCVSSSPPRYFHALVEHGNGLVTMSTIGPGGDGVQPFASLDAYVRAEGPRELDSFDVMTLFGTPLSASQEEDALVFFNKVKGEAYAVLSLLEWPLCPAHDPNPDAWICSEYAFACAGAGLGVPLLNNIKSWQVSPQHLPLSPFLRRISA